MEQISKIEWYASLYLTEEGLICLPSDVFEAALINGAKKLKLGKQAQAGMFVTQHIALTFDDGSESLSVDGLWERDTNRFTRPVRIGTSRVMRTRFIARRWSCHLPLVFDPGIFNVSQVSDIVQITGEIVGVGDWRPKFGRFAANRN